MFTKNLQVMNTLPCAAATLDSALATFIFDTMLKIVWDTPMFDASEVLALTTDELLLFPDVATAPTLLVLVPHTAFTTAITELTAAGDS